jgi:uncharacterized protein
MKIAILSDTHENKDNLKQALETVTPLKVDRVLFCGDLCGPFMIKQFGEYFSGPIDMVFGNNDGDRFRMAQNASQIPHITLHGEYAALEIDGKRIGMTHYPFYATAMAKSGDYDLVVFGHDHELRIETHGACLAVNPGTIYEHYLGNPPSFAIYDTVTHTATLHDLDGTPLNA